MRPEPDPEALRIQAIVSTVNNALQHELRWGGMQFVLGPDEMEVSEEQYWVPPQAFVTHGALRVHQGRLYNDWAISLIGVERTLRDLSAQGLTKLTIVIPVYNEEESIPTLIRTCREVAPQDRVEFVIVENGSSDGSYDLLRTQLADLDNFRVVQVRMNSGFGGGIAHGIQAATTDFVAWIPGNLKVHPQSCVDGFGLLLENERFPNVAAKALRIGRPLYDRTATMAVSVLWSLMTRKILWDTGAPPTIVPRSLLEGRDLPQGFELEVFVTWLIRKSDLFLLRFPVYYGARKHGTSRWNTNFSSQIDLTRHITKFVRKEMMR